MITLSSSVMDAGKKLAAKADSSAKLQKSFAATTTTFAARQWMTTTITPIIQTAVTASVTFGTGVDRKWIGKPIGGGHSLENCSEITTRVGSTPTLSAN